MDNDAMLEGSVKTDRETLKLLKTEDKVFVKGLVRVHMRTVIRALGNPRVVSLRTTQSPGKSSRFRIVEE